MPTYEYRCSECGQLSEAVQKMSDAPLVTCPHCGHESLKRVVTGGAGVIYKGEGWYVTDYSKKSSGGKDVDAKTPSTTKGTPAPKSESSAATSSESSKTASTKTDGPADGGASSAGESPAPKAGS